MKAGKKITWIIVLLILIAGTLTLWRFFGSNTNFIEGKKNLYIKTGSNLTNVINSFKEENLIKNPGTFKWLAEKLGYDKNVKPGKYIINNGASIYEIARLLKSGKQTPVNLVITKLHTKEELAQKIAANFECDSMSFMNLLTNKDSLLNYSLDTNTVMTAIIPNTYSVFWNTTSSRLFKKLFREKEIFWNNERKKKAAGLNLSPEQVYTLASIVEEETNREEDKGKIASVYLNRIEKGMKLAADPTVKYAMRDFGLKRIYNKYLLYPSTYNTYLYTGLPPGPICTPSIKTIDAVLNAPATSYLYFVAKPDLSGYSNFATNYNEHMLYAKAYQKALDSLIKKGSQ